MHLVFLDFCHTRSSICIWHSLAMSKCGILSSAHDLVSITGKIMTWENNKVQPISWFCRLTRKYFRKWLIWDLIGISWLNHFATGYKMRYVLFILSFYICHNVSYYDPCISGYCGVLFVIGQSIPCFEWLSWCWVSREFGGFVFPLNLRFH